MILLLCIVVVLGPDSFIEASMRSRMFLNFVRHNVHSMEEIPSPKSLKHFRSQSVTPRSKDRAEMFLRLSIESESPQIVEDSDDSSTDDSELNFLLKQHNGLWMSKNVPISNSWQFWDKIEKDEYLILWELESEEKSYLTTIDKQFLFYIEIQGKRKNHIDLKNHKDIVFQYAYLMAKVTVKKRELFLGFRSESFTKEMSEVLKYREPSWSVTFRGNPQSDANLYWILFGRRFKK